MTCFMCAEPIGAVYISCRGKKFCTTDCSSAWRTMNPMPVKNSSRGRSGERGPRRIK